jgi:hypothetical protein
MKLHLFINDLFNHAVCYFDAMAWNEWLRVITGSGKKDGQIENCSLASVWSFWVTNNVKVETSQKVSKIMVRIFYENYLVYYYYYFW